MTVEEHTVPAGTQLVSTDEEGRATLPGRAGEQFLLHENSDGSILLRPVAQVEQVERDTPLGALLYEALHSPTVQRPRR